MTKMQDYIDFKTIISDQAFWQAKLKEASWTTSSSLADIVSLQKAMKGVKFSLLTEENEVKKLHEILRKIDYEKSHPLWKQNEWIVFAKEAAQDITNLAKSEKFNLLRKQYAAFRKDDEMLLRATKLESASPRAIEHFVLQHFEEERYISALYYCRENSRLSKEIELQIKGKYMPKETKIPPGRPEILFDIIKIIKDDDYWQSKEESHLSPKSPVSPLSPTSPKSPFSSRPSSPSYFSQSKPGVLKGQMRMKKVVKQYEELFKDYNDNEAMRYMLGFALLRNLQVIAQKYPSQVADSMMQVLDKVLAGDIKNFKEWEKTHEWFLLKRDYDKFKPSQRKTIGS